MASFGLYGILFAVVVCSHGYAVNESVTREVEVIELLEVVADKQVLVDEFHKFFGIEEKENRTQRKPCTIAEMPENINKSRYNTLLPYDETRVILEILPNDSHSDFINANYIDGWNHEKEYVLTQGPLQHTINDFWRMVWMLNVKRIVMLTKLIEHNKEKCAKYWPDTNQIYGDIRIEKISEFLAGCDLVVRTFILQKSETIRVLRHFHYVGWPDLGVPLSKGALVSALRQARQFDNSDSSPILIHCSAGIGRSGTALLIDSMIERGLEDDRVDLLKRLNHMRDQRVSLVEKDIQYQFAYEVVSEFFHSENMNQYLKRQGTKCEVS